MQMLAIAASGARCSDDYLLPQPVGIRTPAAATLAVRHENDSEERRLVTNQLGHRR